MAAAVVSPALPPSESKSRRTRRQKLRAALLEHKADDSLVHTPLKVRKPPGLLDDEAISTPLKVLPSKYVHYDEIDVGHSISSNLEMNRLCKRLDLLYVDLCEKLYEPEQPPVLYQFPKASVDLDSEDIDADIQSHFPDGSSTGIQLKDDYLDQLATCRQGINTLMDHLQEAASLAVTATQRCAGIDMDAQEYFLELYYQKLDPQGVKEALEEQADRERDDKGLRVNLAGHLFTFSRHEFWKLVGNLPPDLHRKFVEHGIAHAAVFDKVKSTMPRHRFEDHFYSHDEEAHSWQSYHSDRDDDDDLMTLLRLLRRLAELKTFFV